MGVPSLLRKALLRAPKSLSGLIGPRMPAPRAQQRDLLSDGQPGTPSCGGWERPEGFFGTLQPPSGQQDSGWGPRRPLALSPASPWPRVPGAPLDGPPESGARLDTDLRCYGEGREPSMAVDCVRGRTQGNPSMARGCLGPLSMAHSICWMVLRSWQALVVQPIGGKSRTPVTPGFSLMDHS